MSAEGRFPESLASWQDWDTAAYQLAVTLGILPPDVPFATDAKYVFWTSNRLGDALADLLRRLVEVGALDYDENEEKYRWRQDFNWRSVSTMQGR